MFKVSGLDENDDVRVFFTANRERAEAMRRQMEEDLRHVMLIRGHIVTWGVGAAQEWEYYETVEEALRAARDMHEQRGITQIVVEDSDGKQIGWRA
ncbi:MAG TPA: hypothetical protein VF702_07500 [Allosphingosinicella sp.]|jgi:hypothetical protein